jgi:hypothetical protein
MIEPEPATRLRDVHLASLELVSEEHLLDPNCRIAEIEQEPATQPQDDLCHAPIPANVWYCSECDQWFDHRVTGPHPKPIPTIKHRRSFLRPQLPAMVRPQRLVSVGVCQRCMLPFIGKDRCQCGVKQAKLVMVQAVKERGRN